MFPIHVYPGWIFSPALFDLDLMKPLFIFILPAKGEDSRVNREGDLGFQLNILTHTPQPKPAGRTPSASIPRSPVRGMAGAAGLVLHFWHSFPRADGCVPPPAAPACSWVIPIPATAWALVGLVSPPAPSWGVPRPPPGKLPLSLGPAGDAWHHPVPAAARWVLAFPAHWWFNWDGPGWMKSELSGGSLPQVGTARVGQNWGKNPEEGS